MHQKLDPTGLYFSVAVSILTDNQKKEALSDKLDPTGLYQEKLQTELQIILGKL